MDERSFRIIRKLRRYLFNLSNPAYIVVNQDFDVLGTMGNMKLYGLSNLKEGDDASNYLNCLIGIDPDETTQIPFYHLDEKVCHVIVMPIDDRLAVLLMDATEAHGEQQQEQQKVNENLLLKGKLEVLTAELQTAQQELEDKNKALKEEDQLKASFIANMSHEFRTPLTAILGYTQILKTKIDKTDPNSEKIQAIERGGKYLLSLVENLLDQMRLEISDIDIHEAPTEIKELLRDLEIIFVPLARKKDLQFHLDDQIADETVLFLDELRLRQVLINLIGNSIKFTDTGDVKLTALYENGLLTLSVEDTGKGISEENLKEILKPFVRVDTNVEGAGLGLSISKHLITAMHGTLEVTSELEKGSKFTIGMEVRPDVLPLDSANRSSINVEENDVSILIAEDDDDLASLYSQLLEAPNITIHQALNGEEAVNLAKQHTPDLIIIDLHMPVMGGKEATKQIRNHGFSNPILAISGETSYSARSEALAAGCNGYIVKPIGLQNLLSTINAYLNIKQKNPITNEGFDTLQKTFKEGLEERLESLENYYKQIINGNMDDTSRNNFHKLVHRISGTASFFKVGRIGPDAEYLDNHLNLIKDDDIHNNPYITEYLLRLINSIKQEIKS